MSMATERSGGDTSTTGGAEGGGAGIGQLASPPTRAGTALEEDELDEEEDEGTAGGADGSGAGTGRTQIGGIGNAGALAAGHAAAGAAAHWPRRLRSSAKC